MSDHGELPARWHEAAALASFAFYEPSNGSERWAGGFASDGTQIEVIAIIDGDEVSVETSLPERSLPGAVLAASRWRACSGATPWKVTPSWLCRTQ